MYTSSIEEGKDYNKLQKAIVILITDYNLEKLQNIKQYATKWNIRETKNPQIILTDALEIYIIELNKVNNTEGSDLDNWLKFINNPEENVDMENKEIQKAKEVLEEISQDEHERYLAELRQKYIMDQKATEDAGYDKGLKSGLKQGEKQNQLDIAKRMKEENMNTETIVRLTKLTEEEVENL